MYGANTACGCSTASELRRWSTIVPPIVSAVYGTTCAASPTKIGGMPPNPE